MLRRKYGDLTPEQLALRLRESGDARCLPKARQAFVEGRYGDWHFGEVQYQLGDLGLASVGYEAACKEHSDPLAAMAFVRLAEIELDLTGDLSAALDHCQRALEMVTDTEPWAAKAAGGPNTVPMVYRAIGDIYNSLGFHSAALEYLYIALEKELEGRTELESVPGVSAGPIVICGRSTEDVRVVTLGKRAPPVTTTTRHEFRTRPDGSRWDTTYTHQVPSEGMEELYKIRDGYSRGGYVTGDLVERLASRMEIPARFNISADSLDLLCEQLKEESRFWKNYLEDDERLDLWWPVQIAETLRSIADVQTSLGNWEAARNLAAESLSYLKMSSLELLKYRHITTTYGRGRALPVLVPSHKFAVEANIYCAMGNLHFSRAFSRMRAVRQAHVKSQADSVLSDLKEARDNFECSRVLCEKLIHYPDFWKNWLFSSRSKFYEAYVVWLRDDDCDEAISLLTGVEQDLKSLLRSMRLGRQTKKIPLLPQDKTFVSELEILSYPQLEWQVYALLGRARELRAKCCVDSDRAERALRSALESYERAIVIVEYMRSLLVFDKHRLNFFEDKIGLYERAAAISYDLGAGEDAFHYAERARCRVLLEMLHPHGHVVTETRKSLRTPNQPAGPTYEKQERMLALDDYGAPATLWQTAHALSGGTACLSYLTLDSGTLVWVVKRDGFTCRFLPVQRSDLQRAVYEYLMTIRQVERQETSDRNVEVVSGESSDLDSTAVGARTGLLERAQLLYDMLVRPIAADLGSERVCIITQGPLQSLPFQTLHDGHSFWVENHEAYYVPSATILCACSKPAGTELRSVLAIGNPDTPIEVSLPYAEMEAQRVAGVFSEASVLLRRGAKESTFKRVAKDYDVIHFAGHGYCDDNSPLASFLAFTRDGAGDGKLTLQEAYDLKLKATLVTLSGCWTGRSHPVSGESVGFPMAFLNAGSAAVVSSLWPVPDPQTYRLMTLFYSNLGDKTLCGALRGAQLEIMKENPDPWYWASFILVGYPGSVEGQ
jgi:CHAT domain-containing protein/tetratricopeptide (TPR) repeat protein